MAEPRSAEFFASVLRTAFSRLVSEDVNVITDTADISDEWGIDSLDLIELEYRVQKILLDEPAHFETIRSEISALHPITIAGIAEILARTDAANIEKEDVHV